MEDLYVFSYSSRFLGFSILAISSYLDMAPVMESTKSCGTTAWHTLFDENYTFSTNLLHLR